MTKRFLQGSLSMAVLAWLGAAGWAGAATRAGDPASVEPPRFEPLGAPLSASPAPPLKVGISDAGLRVQIGAVNVGSDRCYDYTFTGAPTDWVARGGEWAPTSRWTCQPQWSFYGGYSDGIAALWNKRVFRGDISVEAWMAFKMGLGTFSGYRNPNDMNLVLLGDGEALDTGYAFEVGADLNMETRILKNGKVLAQTHDPTHLLPVFENGDFGTAGFHRRWWSVKAERVGNQLSLYLDNKLALTAQDPDPIEQGHVGLWTLNNGILVSRARISYGEEVPLTHNDTVPRLLVAAEDMDGSMPLLIRSKTHPGLYLDFEQGFGTLTNPSGDQGPAFVSVPGVGDQGKAVEIVNVNAGGDFGAKILPAPMTTGPSGVQRIDFDYKLSPDVKVNLFAKVEGGLYEIVFTGLDTASPMAQILGRIEDVKADGKWHHASFNLWAHLRRVFGDDQDDLRLDDLFFAQRSFDHYLMAGFGGNHAGAAYCLDNFALWRPGGAAATLSWEPLGRQVAYASRSTSNYYRLPVAASPRGRRVLEAKPEFKAYAVAFDDRPQTVPPATGAIAQAEWSAPELKPGVHYLHIRPQLADGSWAATMHYMVAVDTEPPHVASVSPTDGATCGDQDVTLRLTDEGGVGVSPKTIAIAVNGEALTLESPGLTYDALSEELTLNPAAARMSFADKQRVEVQLLKAEDYLGHSVAPMQKWAFVVDYAMDKKPPAPPVLRAADDYLCNDTFESDMGEWANYGSANGAIVSRDATTKAGGKYSLKLYNRTNGGLFGAYVRKTSFDAGKYRIIDFDYRVNDRLREDFGIYVNGDWKDIVFTDNDNNLGTIGKIPDITPDNEWHHTELNLYDMLRKEDPQARGYTVRHFVAGDWGTTGNTQRATWWIDNFRITPIVSGAAGLRFSWDSSDMTGIAGASWVLDGSPDTVPPETVSAREPEVVAPVDGSGMKYLHVRTQDGAGNWSETTHYRVLVDAVAPTVATVSPAPDSATAEPKVVIPLSDEGGAGIDPGSLVLVVAGQEYTTANAGMTYDSDRQVLTWDPEQTSPKPTVFADGQHVDVALKSAADYAANPVASLPSWSWTMDYKKDDHPPVVAEVQSRTHPTAFCDTFEDDLGEWSAGPGAQRASMERDATTAASGQQSLKITSPAGGRALSVVARTSEFEVLTNPILSFDYKVPPDVHVDLMIQMDDSWLAVRFTDTEAAVAGQVPAVKADNQWHHATVNLAQLLRSQQPRSQRLTVQKLGFADRGQTNTPPGASFNIDNFMVARQGTTSPTFAWKSTDPTGIVAYAYACDQEPATVPAPQQGEPVTQKTFTEVQQPGLWFFHVRAEDGAGHWGPTRHYGFIHRTPPPSR